MNNSKSKLFFTALVSVLKGIFKLTLITIYFLAKLIEIVASFIRKLLEKVL